jgi:hypothetical protein
MADHLGRVDVGRSRTRRARLVESANLTTTGASATSRRRTRALLLAAFQLGDLVVTQVSPKFGSAPWSPLARRRNTPHTQPVLRVVTISVGRGWRVLVAATVLFFAAYLIYGFGAGYFWPVGLPTPFNVVATIGLSVLVLRWAWRFALAPHPQRSPKPEL